MVRRGATAPDWHEAAPELPFDPEHNPLDALAANWASLDGDPGPDEIAQVRALIGVQPLLNALISVSIARDAGAQRLAEAYRRIAREDGRARLHRTGSDCGGRKGCRTTGSLWVESERTRSAQAKLRGDRGGHRSQAAWANRRLHGDDCGILRLPGVGGNRGE